MLIPTCKASHFFMASAASGAASLTSPAALYTAPLALSALPSLWRSLSPLSLPAPSLVVPLALSATPFTCAIHNALLQSSMTHNARESSVFRVALLEQSQSAERPSGRLCVNKIDQKSVSALLITRGPWHPSRAIQAEWPVGATTFDRVFAGLARGEAEVAECCTFATRTAIQHSKLLNRDT